MNESLFDSMADDAVLQTYLNSFADNVENRQARCKMRLSIYHDDWAEYLEKMLRQIINPETFASLQLMPDTSQNLFKMVVNQTSRLYHVAPDRSVKSPGPDGEGQETPYDDIDLDEVMLLGTHYLRALKDVGFYVSWDAEAKCCRLSLITGENCIVIPKKENPREVEALWWRVENADRPNVTVNGKAFKLKNEDVNTFVFWNAEQHFIFRQKKQQGQSTVAYIDPTELQPEDPGSNPEMINPYGRIPVAWAHEQARPGMFWNTSDGDDIVKATLLCAIKKTLKLHTFKHNSFKRVWLSMPSGDLANEQINDPTQALIVDQGGAVGVLDLQVDFTQIDGAIQSDIDHTLDVYGMKLNQGQTIGNAPQSGISLEIKNEVMKEVREMLVKIFMRVELELFDIIRIVHNYHAGQETGIELIPEDVELSITYNDIKQIVDPKVDREEWDYKKANNLCSPEEYYTHFKPKTTPDQARAALEANASAWAEINGRNQSPFNLSNAFDSMKKNKAMPETKMVTG